HALEERQILKGSRHPHFGGPARGHAIEARAAQSDGPFLRRVDPIDHIQHGALARAVGDDDGPDLVLTDVERNVGQGLDPAESERNVAQVEDDFPDSLLTIWHHDSGHLLHVTGKDLGRQDAQIGRNLAGPAILELDLRLDELMLAPFIKGLYQHRVFLRNEAAPDLAGTGQFVVVGVELLVQDQEASHLGRTQLRVLCQVGIDLFDAIANELEHFLLARQVGVAGVRQAATLGPVAHGLEVDVDEGTDFIAAVAKRHGFLDEGEELQLVLDVLGCEQAAVGQLADILGPVDDLELSVGVEVAGVARVIPAVGRERFGGGFGILVILLEQPRALHLNFAIFGHTDLHAGHGGPDRDGPHLASGLHAHEDRGFGRTIELLEVDADGPVELEEVGADGFTRGIRDPDPAHAQGIAQRPVNEEITEAVLEAVPG